MPNDMYADAAILEQPPVHPTSGFHAWTWLSRALRSREHAQAHAVEVGSDAHFAPHQALAAAPARDVLEQPDATTVWFSMPAAGADNTEIIWVPDAHRLSVGVWSTSARRAAEARRRGKAEPRLLWYSSLWCPYADGRHASARVSRGLVGVHLPHAALRA